MEQVQVKRHQVHEQVSATQDHTLSSAHGHLNLIGFVGMSIFGAFYALSPEASASRLGMVHFWLSVASVAVLVPGIVMAIDNSTETIAKIGSLPAVLSMAMLAFVVLRQAVRQREVIGHRQPTE